MAVGVSKPVTAFLKDTGFNIDQFLEATCDKENSRKEIDDVIQLRAGGSTEDVRRITTANRSLAIVTTVLNNSQDIDDDLKYLTDRDEYGQRRQYNLHWSSWRQNIVKNDYVQGTYYIDNRKSKFCQVNICF